MPDFNKWLQDSSAIDAAGRAVQAWNTIQRNPSSITIYRGGGPLAAQSIRVEYNNTASERRSESDAVATSQRTLILFGVNDHPDVSVVDTDIREKDEFGINGHNYVVIDVIELPGEIQASASRQTR